MAPTATNNTDFIIQFTASVPLKANRRESIHCHLSRFAIRADGEGDATQADGVFPFGLVSEGVAVVVSQREGATA
jgi:hypothetical protein